MHTLTSPKKYTWVLSKVVSKWVCIHTALTLYYSVLRDVILWSLVVTLANVCSPISLPTLTFDP